MPLIAPADFIPILQRAVPATFGRHAPNPRQLECIEAPPSPALFIVAGPGSGKTTVLVLRALRLVFVGDLLPEQVLITTFTRKAAAEIRSRLVTWGLALQASLAAENPAHWGEAERRRADLVDVNRFVTGTLDSVCEDLLGRVREAGEVTPALVDTFVADALLLKNGIYAAGAYASGAVDSDVAAYLAQFNWEQEVPENVGTLSRLVRAVTDRFIHDLVDLPRYRSIAQHGRARQIIGDIHDRYKRSLAESNRLDFAELERVFLERLRAGRLDHITSGILAVLVDEYQDTNPLQEAIYFELAARGGATLTVVGDDDQSLYRFRGATVELFTNFASRWEAAGGAPMTPRYLIENYRSTPEIVNFFNRYVEVDPGFAAARVVPPKPPIIATRATQGLPVFGLFRPTQEALANAIAELLRDVFRGSGHVLTGPRGEQYRIERHPDGGDLGDAVLLSHSVEEYKAARGSDPAEARLPALLRSRLEPAIMVYNPRGRALRDIPEVQELLGLVLECIDPMTPTPAAGGVQANMRLRRDAQRFFPLWRAAAERVMLANPQPCVPNTLRAFVTAWQSRQPQAREMQRWPEEWPALDLFFKLLTWLPRLRTSPEGQVYLEAIARAIAASATVSAYRSMIVYGQDPHARQSIQNFIGSVMQPLAESAVEIDEEVMPDVPRSAFSMMTIHQAKGLEFPLVILDVGSGYRTNHPKTRFKRFPAGPDGVHVLEQDLASVTAVGGSRCVRDGTTRAFDDLRRLYYVAFSRPETALLVVGLSKCLELKSPLPHVATWYRQDGSWAWHIPVTGGKQPAMPNSIPLTLV